MELDEVALFTGSIDGIVRRSVPSDLAGALIEFGWLDLLDEAPDVAVAALFAAQGAHLAGSSMLDRVVIAATSGDAPEDVAAVYPPLTSSARGAAGRYVDDGSVLEIAGVVASRPAPPEWVLVPLEDGELIRARWSGTWPSVGAGVDPASGWSDLHARLVLSVDDTQKLSADTWRAMRAAGHRALAYELIGIGKQMLTMTVEHVVTREQFGRQLATFQVVKHKLADVRHWQEVADLAAEAAWAVTAADEPSALQDEVDAALLAKLLAARFVRVARENCQQLLGGMGFTAEHDFHRYLFRCLVLEPLLGGAGDLRAELGSQIKQRGAMTGVGGL